MLGLGRYRVRQVSAATGLPITPDDRLADFRTQRAAYRYIAEVGRARPGCDFQVMDLRKSD